MFWRRSQPSQLHADHHHSDLLRLNLYAKQSRPYNGDTLVIFPYAAVILATISDSGLGGVE